MAWTIGDLFPPWGDAGERPSDNKDYKGGDQVNEKHFDYLWKSAGDLENDLRTALQDIDNNEDGIVDEADSVTAGGVLKGDLTDSAASPQTIWDDLNKEIPDSALGTIDTTTLAADGDNDGNIDTTALAADPNNDGDINTSALEADSSGDGKIDPTALEADTDGDGLIEQYDEALLKAGGSRALDAADLSGSLGTAGQILQTDGTSASWADISGTDYSWSLGESVTVTNNTGFTMGSFPEADQILVSLDLAIDAGDAGDVFSIRFNQDTGFNYEYTSKGGSRNTGASTIPFADSEHGATDIQGTIFITGRWDNQCTASFNVATAAGNQAQYGVNISVVSPLTEITLWNSDGGTANSAMTGTVNIYTRDTPT